MTEPQQCQTHYSASRSVLLVLEHVSGFNWFERVGQPQNSADPATIRVNLNGNSGATMPIDYIEDHVQVAQYLKSRYDADWLENEESRRFKLLKAVANNGAESEFWNAFKVLIDQLPSRIMQYAEMHLANTDVYLPRVGAGCAVEACFLYALELFVMGRPGDYALDKLKLFELGRWPLCVVAKRFSVF